jgi:hypothetical protein
MRSVAASGSSVFLGRPSNGAILIQWTRSGGALSGSVDQSLWDSSAQNMNQEDSSFTGTIAGNGVTLQLNQGLGETKALVGTLQGAGLVLTYPGTQNNLIQISFRPSSIGAYNSAVTAVENAEETPTTTTQSSPSPSSENPQPSQACVDEHPSLPVVSFGGFCGIKPTAIYVSGDGGNIITNIKWSSWTPTSASGVGTSEIQSCAPNYAEGTDTPVSTTVSFSQPEDGLFEDMTETRNGQQTSYSFVHGYWPGEAS